jgi:hypothetical protein
MRVSPRPVICERVRSQVSTLLDTEVSELDRRLVTAHLVRCAECRAFETRVRALTDVLRAAPLESPSDPVVITRTRPLRRFRVATAEYSVAATLLIGLLGVLNQFDTPAPESSRRDNRAATENLFKSSWQPEQELAQLEDPNVPPGRTDTPGPLAAI